MDEDWSVDDEVPSNNAEAQPNEDSIDPNIHNDAEDYIEEEVVEENEV